jgi:hypothetical protein
VDLKIRKLARSVAVVDDPFDVMETGHEVSAF